MKVNVIIKFQIETEDYHDTSPTKAGARKLIWAMLDRQVDLPPKEEMTITVD